MCCSYVMCFSIWFQFLSVFITLCSKTMLKESANKASPCSRELWTNMDILHVHFTHIFMGTPCFMGIPKSVVTALYSAAHIAESWAFFKSYNN